MEYAYRARDALIELEPGESAVWRLPPMTAGRIDLKSFYSMPPGWSGRSSGGGTPRMSRGGVATTATATLGGDGRPGVMARDARPWSPGIGSELDIGGLDGGSFGPTMELTLELLRVGTQVAIGLNHIAHETQNVGDIWAIKVTRRNDGSLDRRRYRIWIRYPTVLPLEVRRIPIGFFNRGFDRNWNDTNPYLEYFQLRDNVLSYRWRDDFAGLYGMTTDDIHVPLGMDRLKLPTIRNINLRLEAGGRADPLGASIPGQIPRDLPYFQLRIDCRYEGSNNAVLDLPVGSQDIALPDPLWFIARLYFTQSVGGTLSYFAEVESPLLDALDFDVSYPSLSEGIETVNVKQRVKDKLEDYLYHLQHGTLGNFADRLRPWLVGRYEMSDVQYDRNTDEMVLTYVGRQRPPQPLPARMQINVSDATLGLFGIAPEPTWPRLYETPEEMPLPPPPAGQAPVGPGIDAGALDKIDHIVVLMQENRSFDQVLGYLSREGLLVRDQLLARTTEQREAVQAHVDGLLPGDNDRDAIRFPEAPSGTLYRSTRTYTTAWPSPAVINPCHSAECVERQISDGMKGFIADYRHRVEPAYLPLIMQYLTDAELPVFGALTREFAICDKWFCSHIGGTLPNRFINLTGDLAEDVLGSPQVENPGADFAPLETATFFDHLTARGVSWALFEHRYSTLRMVRNFTFDEDRIVAFEDGLRGFAARARAGTLPAVSFIEPDYIELPGGNDDHAPADMINGQILIAKIMDALLASPQWDKTLFVITYDEHGGFYDHVPLPFEITTTAADGTTSTRNIAPLANGERRLGVRVPAFVVSPWIDAMPGGRVNVSSTVFDHTSITATILRRFCGPHPPVMSPRVSEANDLRGLLTRDAARPSSDFDRLRQEVAQVAGRTPVALAGTMPAPPLRRPDPGLEDYHALIAYATSMAGAGRQ